MQRRNSRPFVRILTVLAFISCFAFGVAAQSDPDPNSPTPILLSEPGSTRALAQPAGKISISRVKTQAFPLDSKVTIFISNVTLMDGEGAGAFRVYAIDKLSHEFRFPVESIEPLPARGMFAVTIRLTDEMGYWPAPTEDGDVLIYLTWRGLSSNQVRLGIGRIGGTMQDAPGARPTPIGTTAKSLSGGKTNAADSPDYVGYKWSGDRMRFLEQATFGPTSALDLRVRRIGLRAWLAEQFDTPYASTTVNCASPATEIDPMGYPCQDLKPSNAPTTCDGAGTDDVPATCFRDTYSQYKPQTWFMRQAFYGDAQLRHRVAWALSQIWVNSGVDIQQGRHIVEYHKIISNNAFGNYRNLMKEMTLSPTMGDYLSMSQSTRTNPNENYAREIMQLFTVGLYMLKPNGTVDCVEHPLPTDTCLATDTPIPTYDQNTVNNLTKVLTGWSFCSISTVAQCSHLTLGNVNFIDPMLMNAGVTLGRNNRHDIGAKSLLSYTGSTTSNVAACPTTGAGACGLTCPATGNCTLVAPTTDAQSLLGVDNYSRLSLEQALNNIFYHPNVGPFVAKRLIQQLVTSDPTPAYVGRVAGVFTANLENPQQMKEVVKAILLDVEARGDKKSDPHFGKLREPVLFATNILRTFNVRSAIASPQATSDGYLTGTGSFNGMAQVPFFSPTVFNFYPPDYVVSLPGLAILGPEFAILNTGTSIQRANFVDRFVNVTTPVAISTNSPNGTSIDLTDLLPLGVTPDLLVEELNRRMLHSTMPDSMRSTLITAVTAASSTDGGLARVRVAIYLIATSSQYQVQR